MTIRLHKTPEIIQRLTDTALELCAKMLDSLEIAYEIRIHVPIENSSGMAILSRRKGNLNLLPVIGTTKATMIISRDLVLKADDIRAALPIIIGSKIIDGGSKKEDDGEVDKTTEFGKLLELAETITARLQMANEKFNNKQ